MAPAFMHRNPEPQVTMNVTEAGDRVICAEMATVRG